MELGEHLVRELGLVGSNDTLGRWMAHHVAELMDAAKNAKTPKARKEATETATDTILKIWGNRTKLPGDAYPLARYRKVLKVLDDLAGGADQWQSSQQAQAIWQLERHCRLVAFGLVLMEVKPDGKEPGFDEVVEKFLGAVEERLLGRLRVVINGFAGDEAASTEEMTTAERIRAKTLDLIDRATAELKSLREGVVAPAGDVNAAAQSKREPHHEDGAGLPE